MKSGEGGPPLYAIALQLLYAAALRDDFAEKLGATMEYLLLFSR